MGAYFISRTTKGFNGANTRYLTGRGGWTHDHQLAKSFDSFLDAQCALRGRVADIVRAELVLVQSPKSNVQSQEGRAT